MSRQPSRNVLLATADPVFAALCRQTLEAAADPTSVVAVSPSELLDAARRVAHDVLILDVDQQDIAALKTLASKVMLLTDATMVLTSAYLGPGSAGLGALLQSISAEFVQKPQGSSSLSLADQDGPAFLAALQAAFTAHNDVGSPVETGAPEPGPGGAHG